MHYLSKKGNSWKPTGHKCGRCDEPTYVEVKPSGEWTDHYCCERYGCTWLDYNGNAEKMLGIEFTPFNYTKEASDE